LKPKRGGLPCIGARVAAEFGIRRQMRVLAGGTSYLSTSDSRILLGLGTAARVDQLEIRWPSGSRQEWKGIDGDRWLEATEGTSELRPEVGSKPQSHP
jgi:hypothetical protein